MTLICSISLEGMGPSMSIEGSADGEAFALYIEHFLCPKLKDGQLVVMDNLQVHKTKRVRELIERTRLLAGVLAELFARFQPHRGGVLEA